MGKILYEVEVELHFYVMADSNNEARQIACRNIREEIRNLYPSDFDVHPNPEYVWANCENSSPYGSNDGRTVGEIIEELREEKRKREEYKKYCNDQGHLFPDDSNFENRPS